MFGYVFIAFATFAALQSCQAHSITNNEVEVFNYAMNRGLLDQAQKLIADLLAKITEVVNNCLATLAGAIKPLKDLVQKQIDSFMPILEAAITDALKVIEALEKQAIGAGVSAIECVKDNKDLIIKLINDAKKQIMVCLDQIVGSAQNIVDAAVKEAQDAIKQVNALAQKLAGCGFLQVTCYLGVIADATTLLTTLPPKILALADKVVKEVGDLAGKVPGCVTDTVANAVQNVSNIVKGISKCITDLINGASPKRIHYNF